MEHYISLITQYIQSSHMPVLIILVAFLGGVVASLSPCSLGILPLIVGYVGGYSHEKNFRLFVQLLSFSIGVALLLTVVGVICALTGKAFAGVASPVWILLLASVIMISGLNLLGVIDIQFPTIIKKFPQGDSTSLFVYPVIIGVVFGIASSPCASPILATVLAMASISANIMFAALLLFAFALGQSLIVIICGLFTSVLKNLKTMSNLSEFLLKISGFLFVLAALYIYYKIFLPFFI